MASVLRIVVPYGDVQVNGNDPSKSDGKPPLGSGTNASLNLSSITIDPLFHDTRRIRRIRVVMFRRESPISRWRRAKRQDPLVFEMFWEVDHI